MNLSVDKSELRRYVRNCYRSTAPEMLRQQSEGVCQRLMQHPRFRSADTILLYHPLPDEVDISPLLHDFCKSKTLLLPIVMSDSEGGGLKLRRYQGDASLAAGAFGIKEPTDGIPFLPSAKVKLDLCIVPGMAFDAAGNRLGRGCGYYDRFLGSIPSSSVKYKLGICFSYQLLSAVPMTAHDVRMDEVISGR